METNSSEILIKPETYPVKKNSIEIVSYKIPAILFPLGVKPQEMPRTDNPHSYI